VWPSAYVGGLYPVCSVIRLKISNSSSIPFTLNEDRPPTLNFDTEQRPYLLSALRPTSWSVPQSTKHGYAPESARYERALPQPALQQHARPPIDLSAFTTHSRKTAVDGRSTAYRPRSHATPTRAVLLASRPLPVVARYASQGLKHPSTDAQHAAEYTCVAHTLTLTYDLEFQLLATSYGHDPRTRKKSR